MARRRRTIRRPATASSLGRVLLIWLFAASAVAACGESPPSESIQRVCEVITSLRRGEAHLHAAVQSAESGAVQNAARRGVAARQEAASARSALAGAGSRGLDRDVLRRLEELILFEDQAGAFFEHTTTIEQQWIDDARRQVSDHRAKLRHLKQSLAERHDLQCSE